MLSPSQVKAGLRVSTGRNLEESAPVIDEVSRNLTLVMEWIKNQQFESFSKKCQMRGGMEVHNLLLPKERHLESESLEKLSISPSRWTFAAEILQN